MFSEQKWWCGSSFADGTIAAFGFLTHSARVTLDKRKLCALQFSMTGASQRALGSVFLALHILGAIMTLAHAVDDPADWIPVVAFSSADSSSDVPDPNNWSPDTPQSTVAALMVSQTDRDPCLESNGTRVLVHGIGKSFCVHGWPICNAENHKGLCPHAQHDLPNGSHCATLPRTKSAKSVCGCVEKSATTAPASCHLRKSKT
ncbi:hypothetical protein ON010_g13415 [Phytophthora cinnamomi]|nr:hypothetical protein ON010_g13415 [Phytophthora cinnamomi]